MKRWQELALTAALALIITSLFMGCSTSAAALCLNCRLPIQAVIGPVPAGYRATTTVSGGRCLLTFTPESVKDLEVVLHEISHCLFDADAIGEYGWLDGISAEEIQRREKRAQDYARRQQHGN